MGNLLPGRNQKAMGKSFEKPKKQTFADQAREYGMPEYVIRGGEHSLRYRSPIEKGFAWYWFAKYIVKRDKDLGCISCGKMRELQAGHYGPAANCGLDLLMDETNVHGECEGCNGFDSGHLIGYEMGLVKRYGREYTEKLKERYHLARTGQSISQGISRREWARKAIDYRAKVEV